MGDNVGFFAPPPGESGKVVAMASNSMPLHISSKSENPDLYAALLYSIPAREHVDWAIENGIDAIHPLFAVPEEDVELALGAGLQVNIWTVNEAERMLAMIDLGATALITDEPAILSSKVADMPRRSLRPVIGIGIAIAVAGLGAVGALSMSSDSTPPVEESTDADWTAASVEAGWPFG